MKEPITIYTDGGCKPNPGIGGWAALLIHSDTEKAIFGYDPATTNNRMELTAAVRALESLKQPSLVEFHTDSTYLRSGITSWLAKWQRNGWRTSAGKPVENQDLWRALFTQTQQHNIRWVWVRGHAGNRYNERVDKLATQAREQRLSSD